MRKSRRNKRPRKKPAEPVMVSGFFHVLDFYFLQTLIVGLPAMNDDSASA
jgi:hypothetical protein